MLSAVPPIVWSDVRLIEAKDKSREKIMELAVTPAYFVPDTVKADTLFRNMKKGRHQMAVVMDEYGGMSGIITMNDLVEQLVGDLGTDDVEEEQLIEQVNDNTWAVHGSASLEEISEVIGVMVESEDYDTLNGLIFSTLGTIPEDGTDIELSVAGLYIKVTEIENHQVEMAIVKKVQNQEVVDEDKDENE